MDLLNISRHRDQHYMKTTQWSVRYLFIATRHHHKNPDTLLTMTRVNGAALTQGKIIGNLLQVRYASVFYKKKYVYISFCATEERKEE